MLSKQPGRTRTWARWARQGKMPVKCERNPSRLTSALRYCAALKAAAYDTEQAIEHHSRLVRESTSGKIIHFPV